MTNTFNCPACGAPLDYDGGPDPTIRCPFCHNVVIVPPELRTATIEESIPDAQPRMRTLGQLPQWGEIGRLVKAGQKIEAIKLFRELTGAGLKESKDAIEKLESGRILEVARYAVTLDQKVTPTETERAAQIQQIGHLLKNGQKIEAIKIYREIFGVGLKEAKDAIEKLQMTADTPGAFDIHPPTVTTQTRYSSAGKENSSGCSPVTIVVFVLGLAALIFGCYALAILDEYDTWDISIVFEGTATYTPAPTEVPRATEAPAPTSPPTPPPTPELAQPNVLAACIGESPGCFLDATSIGVDGEGHIYVGEYESGRVQVFDSTGEFIDQWRIEQNDSSLRKMAVADDGTMYIVADGNVYKYEGLTGKLLGQIEYAGGQGFQDVAVTAEDGLVTTWNRDWRGGLFTNFDESQDDIVIFDSDGNVVNVIAKALSEAAGADPELDTLIAVDADGNIYATGDLNPGVYKFTPAGRFVDKYTDERLQFIYDMALDDQGRLFVAASGGTLVFDADGQFVGASGYGGTGLAFNVRGELLLIRDPEIIKLTLNR